MHPNLHFRTRGSRFAAFPETSGLARHAVGRSRGGGRHGAGSGRDAGGDDFDHPARGRKFSADDLQLLILTVLADGPRHGYELIKLLAERSGGAYSPSPGMIYPTLSLLEDLGHAVVHAEGTRKQYSISDAGRAHLESQRPRADLVLARLGVLARKMDVMRRALAGESPEEGVAWLPEFIDVRRALKHALLTRHDASADEQRRIVAILRRALAEIEGEAGRPA